MDSQSIVTLADVMAKLDNLIQPLESHNQRMKRGSPCMASTTREVVEESNSTIPLKSLSWFRSLVISSRKISRTSCHRCVTSNTLLIKKHQCSHIPCVTFNTILIKEHQCSCIPAWPPTHYWSRSTIAAIYYMWPPTHYWSKSTSV